MSFMDDESIPVWIPNKFGITDQTVRAEIFYIGSITSYFIKVNTALEKRLETQHQLQLSELQVLTDEDLN